MDIENEYLLSTIVSDMRAADTKNKQYILE